MSTHSYYEGFEEYIINGFPQLLSLTKKELWEKYADNWFNKLSIDNKIVAKASQLKNGDIIVKTKSGKFNVSFLNWLECHSYLGHWSTFKEAYEQLKKRFEIDIIHNWFNDKYTNSVFISDKAARESHHIFCEVSVKEGYIPMCNCYEDIMEDVIESGSDIIIVD